MFRLPDVTTLYRERGGGKSTRASQLPVLNDQKSKFHEGKPYGMHTLVLGNSVGVLAEWA